MFKDKIFLRSWVPTGESYVTRSFSFASPVTYPVQAIPWRFLVSWTRTLALRLLSLGSGETPREPIHLCGATGMWISEHNKMQVWKEAAEEDFWCDILVLSKRGVISTETEGGFSMLDLRLNRCAIELTNRASLQKSSRSATTWITAWRVNFVETLLFKGCSGKVCSAFGVPFAVK